MKNMSIVNKSSSWTMDKAHEKELNIRRLKHNKVNFEVTFNVNIIFMNPLHCPAVSLFDI